MEPRETVYKPREDSYFLAEFVNKLVEGRVLDMGTGSGIQAVTAASNPKVLEVIAVDLNPIALKVAKKRAKLAGVLDKITFICSNLFERVEGKFHWIIFNPPYLPSEGSADEASWTGGETGTEIIKSFLREVKNYLTINGSVLLLYSSLSNLNLDKFDYPIELLAEKNLFYEKLKIVRLSHF
jgi:release factor glutamine methyltransferase